MAKSAVTLRTASSVDALSDDGVLAPAACADDSLSDVSDSSDVFGRTGGEEFGLVLPATDAVGARWLVEAVRREVEALELPAEDGCAPVRVTVSAGVAVADAQSRLSGDRLYGQADQSLYEAKHAGRNRVEVYGSTAGVSATLPLT